MKCVFCDRTLFRPALLVAGRPVGPVCARRAGLIQPKRRATTCAPKQRAVRQDVDQLDLWGVA